MYRIGKINPLFFNQREYPYEVGDDYIQKFHSSDRITYQILSDTEESPLCVLKCLSDVNLSKTFRSLNVGKVNDSLWVFYDIITNLGDGIYQMIVAGYKSKPFEVTSCDSILDSTKLIRYTHNDNKSPFANIFVLGDKRFVFEQRIECGFISGGQQPKLDAETYRDQKQVIHHLYAYPYLVETLTFGNAAGLPAYYADFINSIFCLDYVSVDGQEVRRNDAVPSLNAVLENAQKYIITLDVELNYSVLEDRTSDVFRQLTDENGLPMMNEESKVLYVEI